MKCFTASAVLVLQVSSSTYHKLSNLSNFQNQNKKTDLHFPQNAHFPPSSTATPSILHRNINRAIYIKSIYMNIIDIFPQICIS
jgi:hypothetical protein